MKENEQRLQRINAPYNPLVGTPYSPAIPRTSLALPDAPIVQMNIPTEMESCPLVRLLRLHGSLQKVGALLYPAATKKRQLIQSWRAFLRLRCQYDFEFWCCSQIKIKIKGTGERDWFILNRAQRTYLETLERLRKAGKPIDVILLKARQWGGSTMTQLYMLWIQKMWRKHWNSVICGDVEKQSKVVLAMLESAARDYDPFIDYGKPTVIRPYGRADSIRLIEGRDCTISVGSAQKPDKVRSEDISMAHLTEVGLWKATTSKTPEDLIESITGGILADAYTLLVLESTAKGVGNYFHRTWQDACRGKNNFTPVFVSWFEIDLYQKELPCEPDKFVESLTDYEQHLFQLGATLQAIYWYRIKSRSMEPHRMKSEFPSTDTEAFQSTGANFFPNEYVDEQYHNCTEPTFVGDIVGLAPKGEKALQGLHLVPTDNGKLKVWADADTTEPMQERYLVTVDLGKGHTSQADNSVICVFDRYWQREADGIPEVVAEWAGHLDMDLLAFKAAQIAAYYGNALLVIESNTIETSSIDYFRTVLVEIKDYYPNLYKRAVSNKIDDGSTGAYRYGWSTNSRSKPEICNNLLECLREGLYIERCREAVDEMRTFEEKQDGSLGAVDGCHDDRVITRAIGMHFCYKKMGAPRPLNATASVAKNKPIINEMTL